MNKMTHVVVCALLFLGIGCSTPTPYTRINGFAQGTTYSICYEGTDTLQGEIDALLARFDSSLSIYNRASTISRVNYNEITEVDSFFISCFSLAQRITEQTNGAFDMSAAPLFLAWGFGSQKQAALPTPEQVDSIKKFCGMDKIRIENNNIVKVDPRVRLNANAIAKGYSVDVVSQFLEGKGKKNYLVEIGGEIFCRGVSPKGRAWIIGIDRPTEGNFVPGQDVLAKVQLSGRGLATSGNYRKFYIQDGRKVAHCINPRTGFPAYTSVLSTTVIAEDSGTADAFATALMVVGLDSAKAMLQRHPHIDAYLVYASDSNDYESYATEGFVKNMVKK